MWSPDELSFVVLTHRGDIHYCRALLASLHHFYPDHSVHVMIDGSIRGKRLTQVPNVSILHTEDLARSAGLPLTGYLAKLNVFYLTPTPYIAYFDADSILIGALLQSPLLSVRADFYALQGEWLDTAEHEARRRYARYGFDVDRIRAEVDAAFDWRRLLLFWSGNFIMKSGAIPVTMIEQQIEKISTNWSPEKPFHLNDQSFLSYAVNKLYYADRLTLRVAEYGVIGRDTSQLHPEISLENVLNKSLSSSYILHFTQPCRKPRFSQHEYGDILCAFRDRYYEGQAIYTMWLDDSIHALHARSRAAMKRLRWTLEHKRLRG